MYQFSFLRFARSMMSVTRVMPLLPDLPYRHRAQRS
jgi:hypothetical protein